MLASSRTPRACGVTAPRAPAQPARRQASLAAPARRVRAMAAIKAADGVSIRRHPPSADAEPANILEKIVWHKATEIEAFRQERSDEAALGAALAAQRAAPARDFIGALRAGAGAGPGLRPALIAEVKRSSPSRGVIQADFDPVRIGRAYEAGGASCLSVLTDAEFFGGGFENLSLIRGAGVSLPLLCKEFVVDERQLWRAREAGADAALLIAAVLPDDDLATLLAAAQAVGLQVLLEVHSEAEMARALTHDLSGAMLGINNRDLGTFVVDLDNTRRIMDSPPGREASTRGLLVACESGIFTPADVARAADARCGAILVGESLVREGDPAAAVKALLS